MNCPPRITLKFDGVSQEADNALCRYSPAKTPQKWRDGATSPDGRAPARPQNPPGLALPSRPTTTQRTASLVCASNWTLLTPRLRKKPARPSQTASVSTGLRLLKSDLPSKNASSPVAPCPVRVALDASESRVELVG
jgi:hypothetical protein